MKTPLVEEQVFRGAVMFVGVILGSVVAHHYLGWTGAAGVMAAYCFWRAT